jgi:predicted amidophosphoribosyltransferase
LSGSPQTQWNINLGQALLEERKLQNQDRTCKMCHRNRAEFEGFCGDCYSKLGKDSKTDKVAKHRFWLLSFFHLFDN